MARGCIRVFSTILLLLAVTDVRTQFYNFFQDFPPVIYPTHRPNREFDRHVPCTTRIDYNFDHNRDNNIFDKTQNSEQKKTKPKIERVNKHTNNEKLQSHRNNDRITPNYNTDDQWQDDINNVRDVYTTRPAYTRGPTYDVTRRPTYDINQRPDVTKRPTYTTERVTHTAKRSTYTTERSSYTKRPMYTTERPTYTTKRPVYTKRPNSYDTDTRFNDRDSRQHYTTRNPFLDSGVRPAVIENRPPITNRPVTQRPVVHRTQRPTKRPYVVHARPTDPGSIAFPEDDTSPEIIIGPDEDKMTEAEKRRYIDIAEKMCDRYKSLFTTRVEAIPLLPSPDPVQLNVSSCAPSKIPLVVGGKVVGIREFPHMALVGWQNLEGGGYSWKCGGSLVSEQYVLTAGHCSYQERDNTVMTGPPGAVQLGSSYLDDPGALVVRVAATIRHPKYKASRTYHDVALLKLVTAVKFSEVIRPACLGVAPSVGNPIIATGWGHTKVGGEQSQELRSVSLPIWDMESCRRALGSNRRMPDGPLADSQICAGERAGGKDTCQGDSGGPAQIQDGCVWRVVAVTSHGISCAAANTPGVYALVSPAFIAAQIFSSQRNPDLHNQNSYNQNQNAPKPISHIQNQNSHNQISHSQNTNVHNQISHNQNQNAHNQVTNNNRYDQNNEYYNNNNRHQNTNEYKSNSDPNYRTDNPGTYNYNRRDNNYNSETHNQPNYRSDNNGRNNYRTEDYERSQNNYRNDNPTYPRESDSETHRQSNRRSDERNYYRTEGYEHRTENYEKSKSDYDYRHKNSRDHTVEQPSFSGPVWWT